MIMSFEKILNTEIRYLGKNVTITDNRLSEYFCLETIVNLSNWVLTDTGIKVLEKGLDFAPNQNQN